jgi:hypothetical protein
LEKGLIEEATSAWNAPTVLVKKPDGSWRFCIDYRHLNEDFDLLSSPIPKVDEAIQSLGNRSFFSTLDLTSGFFQVELDEESKDITAFSTPIGQFRWNRLPMGPTSLHKSFRMN